MMKRRFVQGLLILALLCGAVLLAHPSAAWAEEVTATKPDQVNGVYQIGTAEELYWFAGLVNGDTTIIGTETQKNTAANAVLTDNITINENVLVDGNLNSDQTVVSNFTKWTPIGDKNNGYTGTFDGKDHKISGLYIDSDARYAGLFGCIGSGGTVKNLTLADSYISGGTFVGGICGYNRGSITSCSNSGDVSGSGPVTVTGSDYSYVGGICGLNSGSITNCSNIGPVTGSGAVTVTGSDFSYVGGICGYNAEGRIENCSNIGTVTGSGGIANVGGGSYVGGICGLNDGGSITTCSTSGDVSGSGPVIVTGSDYSYVGGICGLNRGSIISGTITNCSNSGPVTGSYVVGGICGLNRGSITSGTITNCSNSGTVTVHNSSSSSTAFVGGICGYHYEGSITNCYWLETAYAWKGVGVKEAGATVTEVLSKTAEAYESGEVAWLLNQGQTEKPWGQGSNGMPVLISNCPEGVTTKTPVRITIEMQNDETTEQYGYTTAGSTLASYPNNYMFFEDDQYSTIIDKATKTFDEDTTIYAKAASPVTGIALNKTTLALYINDTEQLTATVAPEGANGTILWTSSDPKVAAVDGNGSVHAVRAGTATITAAAASDSSKNAVCTVTVTESVYGITADTTTLNFGSVYTGYAQPAAQTVTLTNTGNRALTLTQPASTNSFEVGALSTTSLPVNGTATFTVQPKAGLSVGTYSETIEVTGTGDATVTISVSFTVKSRPSYNPPTVSEETADAIKAADPGETVTVDLSSGSTKLDKEVFETLAGRDVTLVVDLGDGLSWTVNGSDIPENADFTDIDMGVTMNSDGIPVDIINAITGEHGSVQVELAHNGAFGFTMTLTAPLGAENAGLWANLYYFDEDANAMTFETAAKINSDGSVSLSFNHASQYAIVIDDHNHGIVTLPFTDVSEGDWFYDPVCYVYSQGLMTGTSATTFEPNTSLSRAMLVAVLHRLEGSPAASAGDFSDVASGDWYAQAVNWAASVGVVNGFDDGTFQPNAAITREQLAAILRNYAEYKGLDVTAVGDLSTYSDANSVSDWAKDSVVWAVGSGLLGGYEDNTLRPQGTTTRAEVASVLQRYLEK